MSHLFHDLDFVKVHLNDVLIHSYSNEDDHLQKLKIVLDRLQSHGLKVKVKKCKVLQKEVEYLGHKISEKGVVPLKNKIDAILQLGLPTTRKQFQGFLGMTNYYRCLYPTSKIKIKLLTDLTLPKTKFKWNKEAQSKFEKIKELLIHDTLLVCSDFSKPISLETDASDKQLGGIMC